MTSQPCKTNRETPYKKGERVYFFDYYHYQSADKMKLATVIRDQCGPEVSILVDGEENFGDQWGLESGRLVKLDTIFDIYEDEIETVETDNKKTAPAKVERVRVKLYFDANNICLGGCADGYWLKDYNGDYVASEYFKLTPGFDPEDMTIEQLREVQRLSNPYKIAAMATAAALEAKLAAETAAAIAEVESNGLEAKAAAVPRDPLFTDNSAAEVAAINPALAKIKTDYPNLDISNLERAFIKNEVLEIKQIRGGSIPIFLTLRVWGNNEWVTHHYNAATNGFELGWYFRDLKKARANFKTRKRSETLIAGPIVR